MKHSLETIAERQRLFGRDRRPDWAFDATQQSISQAETRPLRTCLHPRKVRSEPWNPKVEQPGYGAAKQQGCRATGSMLQTKSIRVPFTIVNEKGEEEQRKFRLTTNTLVVTCYGKSFEMRKCNRGHTIFDGRSGKRVSADFAKSELCRILDRNAGLLAYAALMNT